MSQIKQIKKHWKHWVITGVVLMLLGFSLHLSFLFKQLNAAFQKEHEFIPTRFYSDVSLIAHPIARKEVDSRLKSLGYSPILVDSKTIDFTLHTIDYPITLLPQNHPTSSLQGKLIRLQFESAQPQAPLEGIFWKKGSEEEEEWEEVSEIFLEPELIATLGKSDLSEKREIRKITPFSDIPASIWQAVIAVEDPRYLDHKGLDPRGIARAFWVNVKTASLSQGGSTITAQLVKNLMARRTRNLLLKFNELFLSLLLETRYSKEEILERYLNEVYLGQAGPYEIHGVAEGARLFFGKNLDELTLAEASLMAGLIRGPAYYSPYRHPDRARERQSLVLQKMVEAGFIAPEELSLAQSKTLKLAPLISTSNKAPFFSDFVKAEMIRQLQGKFLEQNIDTAGLQVYTTMDTYLNQLAQNTVTQGVLELEKKLNLTSDSNADERLEGALASVDHETGFIRALIGGKNYALSTFNRILNMKRQVGSTFKPIVYLTAFLQGQDANGLPYGTGYPLEDAPWTLSFDRGRQTWKPKNYEVNYLGWIPLRTALSKSINTVAAKLGVQVGIPSIIETAHALGIQSDLPEVPSLSLGVAELSPVELLTAYATIAHHGIQDELTVIRAITYSDGRPLAQFVYRPRQALPQAPIDLLIETMKGTFSEGTAVSALRMGLNRPAAGKTGTTSSYRDAWFAGFTPELTTVVWVGMDQNTSLIEKTEEKEDSVNKKGKKKKITLTGSNAALPIWVNYMKGALEGKPFQDFLESPYLVSLEIDSHTGELAAPLCSEEQIHSEFYMRDNEPTTSSCKENWPESVPLTQMD